MFTIESIVQETFSNTSHGARVDAVTILRYETGL